MTKNNGSTIRTFNRFELKYLVSLQQAERFKTGMRPYVIPDEYGHNNGRYSLSSLYYDSPSFRCFRENLDGIRFRRKLRVRRYETGEILAEDRHDAAAARREYERLLTQYPDYLFATEIRLRLRELP